MNNKTVCISCGKIGYKGSAPSGKYIYREGYCEDCAHIFMKVKNLIEAEEKIKKNSDYFQLILQRVSNRISKNDNLHKFLYDKDINELRQALYDYMCVRRTMLGVENEELREERGFFKVENE